VLFQDIEDWLYNFATQYGYLGIFLISLLGAMSIFVPIPYTVVIFILGGLPSFDPLLIAVAAGAGAAIGEFSGKLFKKLGPIAIFVFALTPLPDDLLFIPLGVMRYGLLQAFVPALIGKFFSNLIIAYSGRLSLEIVKSLFGVEGEGTSLLIGTIIGIVLLVIVFIIMFKVDWEKRFAKYLDETEKDSSQTSEDVAATKDE